MPDNKDKALQLYSAIKGSADFTGLPEESVFVDKITSDIDVAKGLYQSLSNSSSFTGLPESEELFLSTFMSQPEASGFNEVGGDLEQPELTEETPLTEAPDSSSFLSGDSMSDMNEFMRAEALKGISSDNETTQSQIQDQVNQFEKAEKTTETIKQGITDLDKAKAEGKIESEEDYELYKNSISQGKTYFNSKVETDRKKEDLANLIQSGIDMGYSSYKDALPEIKRNAAKNLELNDIDRKEFDIVNTLDRLEVKKRSGAISDEDYTSQVTSLKKQKESILDERFEDINEEIADIANDISSGEFRDDPEATEEAKRRLADLRFKKENFFSNNPETVAKTIAGESASSQMMNFIDIMPEDLDSKEKFETLFMMMYKDTYRKAEKLGWTDDGEISPSAWSTFKGFYDLSNEEKEVVKSYKETMALKDLFLFNRFTEEEAGFFQSTWQSFSSILGGDIYSAWGVENGFAHREIANITNNFIQESGLDEMVSKEGKEALNELGQAATFRDGDYSESFGNLVGMLGGIATLMRGGDAALSRIGKAGAYISNTKAVNNLKKVYDSSKVANSSAVKFTKNVYDKAINASPILTESVKEGLRFEATGEMFKKNEDIFNFSSGLFGALASNTLKAGIGAGVDRLGRVDKAKEAFNRMSLMYGDKTVQAAAKVGDFFIKTNTRGAGEAAEELAQELVGVFQTTEGYDAFKAELKRRFPDSGAALEFFAVSFLTGSVMGGSQKNSAYDNVLQKKYDELSEADKAAADDIVEEHSRNMADAINGVALEMEQDGELKESPVEVQGTPVSTELEAEVTQQEAEVEQAIGQAIGQDTEQVEETQDAETQIDETIEPTEAEPVTEQATEQVTEQDIEEDLTSKIEEVADLDNTDDANKQKTLSLLNELQSRTEEDTDESVESEEEVQEPDTDNGLGVDDIDTDTDVDVDVTDDVTESRVERKAKSKSLNRRQSNQMNRLSKVKNSLKNIIPELDIRIHLTEDAYLAQEGSKQETRGFRKGNEIHINLDNAKNNTIFHEAIHPILEIVAEKNPEFYNELANQLASDESLKGYLDSANEVYTDSNTAVNEALTEMMADVADGNVKPSVIKPIVDFFKNILNKLGLRPSDFNVDLNKPADLKDFANIVGEALGRGQELKINEEFVKRFSVSDKVENAKQAAQAVYNKLSDSSKDLYEAINKSKEITFEGLKLAMDSSRKFRRNVRNVVIATSLVGTGVYNLTTQDQQLSLLSNMPDSFVEVVYENAPTDIQQQLDRAMFLTQEDSNAETVSTEEVKEEVKAKSPEEIAKEEEKKKYIEENTYFDSEGKEIPLKSGSTAKVGMKAKTKNFTNQFPADSGFVYIAAPNNGTRNSKGQFKAKGEGVAQFLLDASVSDSQAYNENNMSQDEGHYMHKNAAKALEVDKKRDGFVPVYEKLGGNKVRVKYKKFSELSADDKIMSPLRQVKFSDLDWKGSVSAKGKGNFGAGIMALPYSGDKTYPYPGKEGTKVSDFVFKNVKGGKDKLGLFEGVGAVFIFEDASGNRFVREYNGSINQIAKTAENIMENYGVKPEELTIGYHDVGSYSSRPAAQNGTVDSQMYDGYNKSPEAGGALYYPPKGVQFQEEGLGDGSKKMSKKDMLQNLSQQVEQGKTLNQAIEQLAKDLNVKVDEVKSKVFGMNKTQETAARKRVVDADKKKKREGKLKEAEKAAAEKVDKAAKDKRKTERTRKVTADEAKKDVEKAREEKKKEEARDRAKKRKAEVRKEVEKTKMPEKKVRETISLELKDLLRLVEKGQRNASRAAKDLTKIVTNKDNSVIFDVINKRTFKSLMNQISRVKTNDEFVAASARLNELVEENKFKRKVVKAEKLQKKIKTGINQIGSVMSTLKNVDPRLMTEEVLDKYTEILNDSNVGGKVQTPPSNEVINDFIEEYNISKIELEEKAEKESKSVEEKTQEEKEKVETLSNSISERIRVNKPNVGNLIDSSWFRGMNESLKFSKGIVGDLYSLSKNDLVNFTSSELNNLNRIFEQLEENGRLSERAYTDFISKVKRRRQQDSIKGTIKKDNKLIKKGQDLADVDKKLRDKRNNVKDLMKSVERWSVLDTIGDFLGMLPDTFTKAFTDKINPSLRKAKLSSKKALEKPQELYEKLGRGNFVTDSLVESILTTKKRKFKSGVKNQTIIYRDKALDMLRMQKAHEASGFVGDNVLERIDNETSGAERDLHKKIHEALIKKYPKTVDGKTSINWEKAMRDMPSQMKEMNSELDLLYAQDLLDKHYASKAIMRGENTVVQPYYNPVIASNLDMGDVDVDDMLSGSGNISNLSAKAKSSKEKKATDTAHRWGAFRNALQTTTEVYNDYHLTPMLNEVYRAVDALSKSDKDTEFLFNSVKAILKAQIESTVGFNNSGIDTRLVNKLVRFSSSRLYSRYLSKAKRIPAELGSLASLVVGKKGMTKALNTSFNNEEFKKWEEMTAEFGAEISSKIRGNVLEQSIASDAAKPVSLSLEESRAGALINAATSGISARIAANYDDAVNNIQDILRFPAWRASFIVNFKEETGEDFDINKYESYDPKLIEKIVASSDTDIRKTISPSSIESQSLRSKQAVLVSQDKNAISQALGTFYKITNRFMQGFTFNQTKILQSHIRNFAFYDSQGKKKAVESMMRVLISNMVYNVSAQVIGAMITDLFDSLVGDDDEDEKLTSAVMSQMFGEDAGNYWARQVATSLFTSGITNGLGNLVKRPLNFAANSVNNIISYYQNEGDIEDSRDLKEAISYVPEDAQRLRGVYAKHTLNPFSYGKKSEVYEAIFGGMVPASLESVDGFSTALEAETEGENEVAATQLLYATTSAVQLLLNLPAAGDLIDVTKRHAKKVKEREGFSTSSKSKRKKKSKSSSSRDTGGSSSRDYSRGGN